MKEFGMTDAGNSYSFDRPSGYRICVQGVLDPSWSTRLEGLHIETQFSVGAPSTTVLTGQLEDEAALNGVLAALYGLGFRLISVTTT